MTSFHHLCHSTVCRSAPTALLLVRGKALHQHTIPAGNEPTFHPALARVSRHPCRAVSSMGYFICAETLLRCSGNCWDHPLHHHHPAHAGCPQQSSWLPSAKAAASDHSTLLGSSTCLSFMQHPKLPSVLPVLCSPTANTSQG